MCNYTVSFSADNVNWSPAVRINARPWLGAASTIPVPDAATRDIPLHASGSQVRLHHAVLFYRAKDIESGHFHS